MKKYFTIVIIVTLFLSSCESELSNPNTSGLFMKLLGTPEDNLASELIENDNGGFVIVGSIDRIGLTQNGILLLEVDNKGNTLWQQELEEGTGVSVKKTNDGGYLVLGSQPQDDDFELNDFVLIKTDSEGNPLWTKNYGNELLDEQAVSLYVLDNGEGYVMVGNIEYDNNTSEMWLIRTNSDGDVLFDKRYGFISQINDINNILVLDNGDIVSCGTLIQSDGTSDVRIVLADERGNLKWDKIIQLPGNQRGEDIKVFGDSFFVTGITDHETNGGNDIFLAKISNLSNIEWTNKIGTEVDDGSFSVYPGQGGLALLGYTTNTTDDEVNTDIFFVKTDFQGNEQWNRTFGGNNDDIGISVIETNEGDYALLSIINFENNDMMNLTKFDNQGELAK